MITVRIKISRTQEYEIDEKAYFYDSLAKRTVGNFAHNFHDVDYLHIEYDFERVEESNKFLEIVNEMTREEIE